MIIEPYDVRLKDLQWILSTAINLDEIEVLIISTNDMNKAKLEVEQWDNNNMPKKYLARGYTNYSTYKFTKR